MIESIKLTNFRKHTNSAFNFGAGMTVIRGANEASKSTILEAISYAISGVKALRDSLDDTVTWGEASNTLRVELEITVDSVVYAIKRSKGGAEVNYDGGMVTGQTEVTNYLAKLLKMDAGAAARLTLSNQNEIRGALESGPKATTELIEKLADFDVIDTLVELMQEKLTLGSTAQVLATIASSEEELARAELNCTPVDTAGAKERIMTAFAVAQSAEAEVASAAAAEAAAQEAHSALRVKVVERDGLARAEEAARTSLQRAETKLSGIALPKPVTKLDEQLEALQRAIGDVEKADQARTAHKLIAPHLSRHPDSLMYEGTLAQLQAEIEGVSENTQLAQREAARLGGDIRVLAAKLASGSCSFCGQDFSAVPSVAAKNAEVQKELDQAQLEYNHAQESAGANIEMLKDLRAVLTLADPAATAGLRAGDFVRAVDDNTLPTIYTWVGPDLKDTASVAELRSQASALRALDTAYSEASVRKSEAQAQLVLAQAAAESAQKALSLVPEVTLGVAQLKLDAARVATQAAWHKQLSASRAQQDAESALRDQEAAYAAAVAAVDRAEERLGSGRKQLAALEFNNALLKRVRQCRPLISDKLWNIVLAAVSSYFSEIRGVPSKVSKDSSGFKVDDHPVSSMSGSTLDALGLAIRVALVRTFLPSAPFLILDEPAAAMDGDRTHNMLGFLASCGFQQILLVTHEETSQDIADHLITL